jgi:hypothetical protein
MSSRQYIVYNGPEPTTSARVAQVVSAAVIKTLCQVATPSTTGITLVEWGLSFDGVSSSAVPGICELIQTDVAATGGTSLTPTIFGIDTTASLCVGATNATCYSPATEGTIASVRTFGGGHISPTIGYEKQYPLGREPYVPASKFLRIRVKFAATVNVIAYMIFEE